MGTDSQVTAAEQVLNFITHPAFQSVIQLLQNPLLEKINKLEERNNDLQIKVKELEKATNALTAKTQIIQEEKRKDQKNSPYTQMQIEKRNNVILTGLKEEEKEDLKKKTH
jgi:predicted RNase H-like nuclease (RuvC/YqgF family)